MSMKKLDLIQQAVGNEYEVTEVTVTKNGKQLNGFKVCKVGDNIAPIVYYNDTEPDFTVVRRVLNTLKVAEKQIDEVKDDVMDIIMNKDNFLDHIIPACVNIDRNKNLWEEAPYIPFAGDIVVTFKISWESFCCQITYDMMKMHKLTTDDLVEHASKNCRCMVTTMADRFGPMAPDFFLVITRVSKCSNDAPYGAGVIVSKETVDAIKYKLGVDKFYLLPSSIHEWLALPCMKYFSPEDLRDMVHQVNMEAVGPKDFLSDNIFICDNGTVSVVDM